MMMSRIGFAAVLVLLPALCTPAFGQTKSESGGGGTTAIAKGVLKRGTYLHPAAGYSIRIPRKWAEVPTQIDEIWIVSQFLSNKEYEGHHKLDNSAFHKPVMRVIMFDEEVIKNTKYETEQAGSTTVRKIKLPYRNYKDYVKRNLSKGGFFFSEPGKDIKQGKLKTTRYQVKVEKLTNSGRRTFDAVVYHGQGVHFAVEFEYLTHHYKKLKKIGNRAFKSFKFVERVAVAADAKAASTANWSRADWKKLKPKARHDKRKAVAEQRIQQAINSLPKGWVVKETKHFVILSHASKKYTKRVEKSVECCRAWLDARLGKVTPEYVTRGIVRICKSRDEQALYSTTSGDAFNEDNREVVDYEDKGAGTSGGGQGHLFFGLYNQFIYDKDEYIYSYTPAWLQIGIREYLSSAELKGKNLKFEPTQYETDAFREIRRREVKVLTQKELMHVTIEKLIKGERSEQFTLAQVLRFFRFMEGPGAKHKLFKGKDFILNYMKEVIVQAEDYIDKNPNIRRNDAKTEAEEEAQASKGNNYGRLLRENVCKNVNKVVANWTDKDWESLAKAYARYSKRL